MFQLGGQLHALVDDICHEGSSDEILLLIHCESIFEQYSLLAQYVLARSIQSYRSTLKISSILLLVFKELILNVSGMERIYKLCLVGIEN